MPLSVAERLGEENEHVCRDLMIWTVAWFPESAEPRALHVLGRTAFGEGYTSPPIVSLNARAGTASCGDGTLLALCGEPVPDGDAFGKLVADCPWPPIADPGVVKTRGALVRHMAPDRAIEVLEARGPRPKP